MKKKGEGLLQVADIRGVQKKSMTDGAPTGGRVAAGGIGMDRVRHASSYFRGGWRPD